VRAIGAADPITADSVVFTAKEIEKIARNDDIGIN